MKVRQQPERTQNDAPTCPWQSHQPPRGGPKPRPRHMMILEHDAKELLAATGVPVPKGILATTADVALPASLAAPFMVKAQIPIGGGKSGGMQRAGSVAELRLGLGEILGKTIKGQTVRACRIEQCVEGTECY